jgi:hypothetical protein
MYGSSVESVGSGAANPFIKKPQGVESSNPFTANRVEDKTNQSGQNPFDFQANGLNNNDQALKHKMEVNQSSFAALG